MLIIYAFLKSFFQDDGVPEGLSWGREDVYEGVFFHSSVVSVCVVPPFLSTRGSSDSIAPRDSLPTGSQDMKGSLLH